MLRTQGVPARIATGYVPGVRDKVSGVFEVRASDAHAWVEVWFPDSGWQAFDPTASVPLSGEAERGSVGADLVGAAISGIASRPVEVGLAAALVLAVLGAFRSVTAMLRRHRRGRWGVLQDRFTALASTALASTALPSTALAGDSTARINNPRRAAALHDARAVPLAVLLDRVAFDPDWRDSDGAYDEGRTALDALELAVPVAAS